MTLIIQLVSSSDILQTLFLQIHLIDRERHDTTSKCICPKLGQNLSQYIQFIHPVHPSTMTNKFKFSFGSPTTTRPREYPRQQQRSKSNIFQKYFGCIYGAHKPRRRKYYKDSIKMMTENDEKYIPRQNMFNRSVSSDLE